MVRAVLKTLLLLVGAVQLGLAAPSYAKKPMTPEERDAFTDRALVLFVDCHNRYNYKRAKMEQLTRLGPDHPKFMKAEELLDDPCHARGVARLKITTTSFYHNLFTSFYARDYGLAKPPVMTGPVGVSIETEFDDPATISRELIATRHFGACVAGTDPVSAHGYLSTGVRIPDNDRHYVALQPAIAACAQKASVPPLNRNRLRGVIAEAMFKYRRAQGDAPVRRAEK